MPTQFGGLSRNPRTSPGRIARAPQSFSAETYRPTAVSTGQSILLDIGSPDNSATYTATFAGGGLPSTQTISVTTDGSATDVELGDLFQAAIEANSTLGSQIAELSREGGSGQDVRLLVHRGLPAITVTLTANPSTAIAVVNTAAGAGTAATFGRFMALGDSASLGDNRTLAPLTAAAGPVITVTIAVDTDGDTFTDAYAVTGAVPSGTAPVASVSYDADTDTATTVPIAVAAYEAAFPEATVTGVTGTGVITIALPVGYEVSAISGAATAEGSSTISVSVADGSDVPTVRLVLDPGDEVPATIGGDVTATPADSTILGLASLHGEVGVEYDAAITFGDPLWIETADGANKGRPYTTASPSRFLLTGAHWVRQDEVDPDTALIYVGTI